MCVLVRYLRDVDLFDKELSRVQRAEAKRAAAPVSDRVTRRGKRKVDDILEDEALSSQQQQSKRASLRQVEDADSGMDLHDSGDDDDNTVDAAAAAAASVPNTPGTPGGSSSSRRYANADKAGNHAGFADLAALVSNPLISLLVCMPLQLRHAFKGACTPYLYIKALMVLTPSSSFSSTFSLLVLPTDDYNLSCFLGAMG
jgi:hypothetical protein